MEIDIPDDVEILELRTEDLPGHWNLKPPSLETQYTGNCFVKGNEVAVLKVPTSIVPPEYNYLSNPNPPESKLFTVISKTQLTFDRRFEKIK